MGTNCGPFIADLFLFCYERDFMMSFSSDTRAAVIEVFNFLIFGRPFKYLYSLF